MRMANKDFLLVETQNRLLEIIMLKNNDIKIWDDGEIKITSKDEVAIPR